MSKKIESGSITNKTWNYKKGNMNLSFTINIDFERDLKDFKEMLEGAVKDINEQIEINK